VNNVARFLDTPLALARDHEAILLQMLNLHAFDLVGLEEKREEKWKPYDVVGGIAVINVEGVLVHKRTFMFGETDYESLSMSYLKALGDNTVSAVAMLVDSPGGEVTGMFDFADLIYETRGVKPTWAILNESAYSAAYAIASATDHITVPRTGGVGSIGVIAMHLDVTGALEQQGVKVSTIMFGKRKADYYPTTPMGDEARERLQASVNVTGEMFVETVARNRKLTTARVRNTEAGQFDGAVGVQQGLADAVMSKDTRSPPCIAKPNREAKCLNLRHESRLLM
jgi:signal peptide peptidase SppA